MKKRASVSAQYLKLNAVLDTFMTIRILAGKNVFSIHLKVLTKNYNNTLFSTVV